MSDLKFIAPEKMYNFRNFLKIVWLTRAYAKLMPTQAPTSLPFLYQVDP